MNATILRGIFPLLKTTAANWMEDNALRLSAALAYYSIFSIAPLLVLAIGLAGWFFGAEAVRGHLDDQLAQFVGKKAAEGVQSMVQSTSTPSHGLAATIIGLVTLLLGASGVFGQLKDALNTIWEVKPKAGLGIWGFIRQRLLSFGMILVIGFLLLVSLLLTTVLTALNHWVRAIIQLPDWIWGGAALLVSLTVVSALFALIFKVLPDVKIPWRYVGIGAVATGLLFELGKFLLAFYLGQESTGAGFGAALPVVLLLLWVYYASCIMLFGAEFTKVYAEAHGVRLEPTEIAEPVTPEARAQQGLSAGTGSKTSAEPILAETTEAPRRESLPKIFPPPPPARPAAPFPRTAAEIVPYLKARPGISLAAAAGGGAAIGLVSRALNGRNGEESIAPPNARPAVLGAAALILLGRFGGALARQVGKASKDGLARALRKL